MRFGFVGPSYTAQSSAIANEECINFFVETLESGAAMQMGQVYGGREAGSLKALMGTPGLDAFAVFPSGPVRGTYNANGRVFAVADVYLYEVFGDGSFTVRGKVFNDAQPVSIAFNSIQLLIVSAGRAYCYTLATDTLLDVSSQLIGVPVLCDCSDTIGVVMFQNSNQYQMSQVLDFSTWPGQLVNEVSVFPDNITSILFNHRELWVFGPKRTQPYQNTGSAEIYDVIQGALIEQGCAATFSPCRLDNSVFWIGEDERGALVAWRSNGYTPSRVSTHAVEVWLSEQTNVSSLVSYSYQDRGHLFWVLYVPAADCSWVYDVGESLWHKRANWNQQTGVWGPHWSWNHVYAFGKHLVGDWNSGNLYALDFNTYTDNGTAIRRLRRAPTVSNEMEWVQHLELTIDFDNGLGPQPPLVDGNGNPRTPQAMVRWSDNRGRTWSNEHLVNCGYAGEYMARAILRRIGRSRYRIWEVSVTDPVQWTILDAYLKVA